MAEFQLICMKQMGSGELERNCDFAVWSCIWTSIKQMCSFNKFLLGAFCVPGLCWGTQMFPKPLTNCTKPPKQELQKPSQFLAVFLSFPGQGHHLELILQFTPNQKFQDTILCSVWWSTTRRKTQRFRYFYKHGQLQMMKQSSKLVAGPRKTT